MKNRPVLVIGVVALLTVLAAVSGSIVVAQTDSSGDNDPDISNYQVTSDGDEISVSFDSDETLVDIEVDVRGPDNGTLTEKDFDGDRFEGYEATYRADSDGEYTLELVSAEDSSSNDGADDGDYSDSASVQTSDNGTAAASPTPDDTEETTEPDNTEATTEPGDDGETTDPDDTADEDPDDETASPTDDDGAGFGSVVALVALLASALLFYRRR